MFRTLMLTIVLSICLSAVCFGQTKGSGQSVSADLLTVYHSTKTATTESEVTAIAKQCSKVIPDKRRTEVDRKYAENLLAWALNRRGEMRTGSAAKLVEQGKLKEADGLDDLALEDYRTAVDYAPTNWRIHHNLAIALAMKGQYKNAVDRFNEVIKLKDDYPNAYFNRGELYFELKQYAEAIGDYDRAIELSETDPQYFNSRGHCRYLLESYDEAIQDYRKAVELGSDSAVYQTDLADALQATGQWEEAAEMYRQAVATNPKYARAYMNAAWLMATCPEKRFRNTELALSASKKAIELEGNPSARAYDTLAAAHAAAGKATDAVAHQKRAIQLAPEEDRAELKQRLALYQRGSAYTQPDDSQAESAEPSHSIELKSSVRTASDSKATKTSR